MKHTLQAIPTAIREILKISIHNKFMIYNQIIESVWIYGNQLWKKNRKYPDIPLEGVTKRCRFPMRCSEPRYSSRSQVPHSGGRDPTPSLFDVT